jgi:hypothetical protein
LPRDQQVANKRLPSPLGFGVAAARFLSLGDGDDKQSQGWDPALTRYRRLWSFGMWDDARRLCSPPTHRSSSTLLQSQTPRLLIQVGLSAAVVRTRATMAPLPFRLVKPHMAPSSLDAPFPDHRPGMQPFRISHDGVARWGRCSSQHECFKVLASTSVVGPPSLARREGTRLWR